MHSTLGKEMEEDEKLYDEFSCWCNTNIYEKKLAIEDHTEKISNLETSIDSHSAKSEEVKGTLENLETNNAANKKALAEATEIHEKAAAEAHGEETDFIQYIENLKAAIKVLEKHHSGTAGLTLPQLSFSSFLSVQGRGRKGRHSSPWGDDHESRLARSFDDFLSSNGFSTAADDGSPSESSDASKGQLLQAGSQSGAAAASSWSADDTATVQRALKSASAFMQAHHSEAYYPSYNSRSGEILGLLKQLKDEMENDLSAGQKAEMERKAAFMELRDSKEAEIQAGEAQAEAKEDELADTKMLLAEAKEDLGQTQEILAEDQRYDADVKTQCEEAATNFEERKAARMNETKAVAEAIEILTQDEARDHMSKTFAFLQLGATRVQQRDTTEEAQRRTRAARVLRQVASKVASPDFSVMATRVELDSFTKVKKAIDDMVGMLKVEQDDEVKKHDWCNEEIHENELTTAKKQDHHASLTAKAEELGETIKRVESEITAAKDMIAEAQVSLQRATENRKKESMEFQKTTASQRQTQFVLKEALERLAKYYDQALLMQTASKSRQQQQQQRAAAQVGKGKQTPAT